MKLYEKVLVTIVPLDTVQHENTKTETPAYNTSLIELLEFMAGLPVRDQIFMLANTLTVSGYSQAEIAEALGISHQHYRNQLWRIRGEFKDKEITEF